MNRVVALSGLLLLILGCPAPPVEAPFADAPAQIHLSYGTPASTEIVVMWQTKTQAGTPKVEYGAGRIATGTSARSPNQGRGYIHTVTIGGLTPDTEYAYRCGNEVGGWSETGTFRTAPLSPRPHVFAAYGDASVGPDAAAVQALIGAHAPDSVLILGDLSYANGGDQTIWDAWFEQIEPVARRAPHMPAIGNHETIGNDLETYFGRFTLPNNERWYSFDVGDVHVVAVDSMRSVEPGAPQYAWIANDLAEATMRPEIRWKIVFLHYALFHSSKAHPNDGDSLRTNLVPLFDAYHVDLVLSGHVHNYERTYPLNEGAALAASDPSDYVDPTGTVYVVAGTGGAGLYDDFSDPQPAYSAYRGAWHGFAKVRVEPEGTLTVEGIRKNGAVMDAFRISKSAADTLPPLVSFVSPEGGAGIPPGPTSLLVKAWDNAGVIRVEFEVDGEPLATDELAPFAATWNASPGIHLLQARAWDRAGNSTVEAIQVSVLVQENP